MYPSKYLKAWSLVEKPGYLLLYSTKKGSVAMLEQEEYARFIAGRLSAELIDPLTELGMLVTDPARERQEVYAMLPEINRLNPNLNISVIVNLDCNFNCRYCYEGSLKDRIYMSQETVGQLVEFIKGRLRPGIKKVALDFYGGEPLLSLNLIKELSARLQTMLAERGVAYTFSLVTNGSLLTRKTVAELVALGLIGAKVTIDGPPANHNLFRPFKNGTASFELIVKNITDCCDLLKLAVNGNFTRDNYHSFPELLDILAAQGLSPYRLHQVTFHPVMQVSDRFSSPEFTGGCAAISEPWLTGASLYLHKEILRRGYQTHKITPSPCMVDLDEALVINHDGGIFKCVSMIGHDDYKVGDIRQGVADYAATYHLDHWRRHDQCCDCKYLPLCFGGCRYMKFQRDGEMAGVDCQRSYWDATLETLIRQQVNQGQSTGSAALC
ncbi:MAG: geopeptide radical SAM maturase [Proteobacteria bacterium]|nr:geopeptide radical SAM maturase [Pseudomonadota bacterium]MBU1717155.1 geopeptide radical SAM maturase [Pseudomonadota bacterium]